MPSAIVVTGIRSIDRKLRGLESKVQKKVLRQSMRAGLKIMQAEMKSQVPVDSGLTKANIKIRALRKRKRNEVALEVRVASAPGLIKQGAGDRPFFYPAGIEFGDSERQPNPFGRRSYASKAEASRDKTMMDMKNGVEREAKRN